MTTKLSWRGYLAPPKTPLGGAGGGRSVGKDTLNPPPIFGSLEGVLPNIGYLRQRGGVSRFRAPPRGLRLGSCIDTSLLLAYDVFMLTCPSCSKQVPWRATWRHTRWTPIPCPNCRVMLQIKTPRVWLMMLLVLAFPIAMRINLSSMPNTAGMAEAELLQVLPAVNAGTRRAMAIAAATIVGYPFLLFWLFNSMRCVLASPKRTPQ